MEEFRAWLVAKGLGTRTVDMTVAGVARAEARHPGDPLAILLDEDLAASTRTVYAKALVRWARWQGREDLEAAVKDRWPVGRRRAKKVRALGLRSEWPAFVAALDVRRAADPVTWATVRLLTFGGLRIADALGVTREQLEETIAAGTAMIKQKAGADRHLAVTEDLYEPMSTLLEVMRPRQTVADVLKSRRRRTRSAVEDHLRRTIADTARAAGLTRGVTPHALRRTLGHAVHKATGGNLLAARDALGHSDIRTTQQWYLDDAEPEELGPNLEAAASLLRRSEDS